MTRYKLSKKDKKALVDEAVREVGAEIAKIIDSSEDVEVAKVKYAGLTDLFFADGVVALARFENVGLIPSLYLIYKRGVVPNYPSVLVDQGAVPRILNGADVMVPGIKAIEGYFHVGEKVIVRELDKGRVIAIGVSLMSKEEVESSQKGKAIRTLHYLGDEIWELSSR
ncbi:hypothetical protein IG193_06015 [Infirmifilum lucidum]|uniref:PUA domain-containing protein n=1 Tax=Infirmifilum lucidum TaxID=2776706 RepID=A0A7L9FEU4_9CREN|nr:PUA domain-containing protein [Infirmifilum lucidum]QOJ78320.1 hypothetical protein IG193_06015 [Infirmifilum lucidum]